MASSHCFLFYILEESLFLIPNSILLLAWVLFAAISPGIIAFSLTSKVQRYLGASLTGFTLYLFAVYGAIFGIILFEEMLLAFHYYGGALVFAGVYIARKIKTI